VGRSPGPLSVRGGAYTRTLITRARKPRPKPYTASASSSRTVRIIHSLCEPDVAPENGEVIALEASSTAARSELLC